MWISAGAGVREIFGRERGAAAAQQEAHGNEARDNEHRREDVQDERTLTRVPDPDFATVPEQGFQLFVKFQDTPPSAFTRGIATKTTSIAASNDAEATADSKNGAQVLP